MKDIALASGVSIGTVERALKNKGRINPEVAERIRKIAKDMNYQPNIIASGLVMKNRAFKIAIIFSIEPNDFWKSVILGINRAYDEIKDFGFQIKLYYGKNFDPTIQLQLIDQAITDGASGIIIVPINTQTVENKIAELKSSEIPVVFLNNKLDTSDCLTSIHCDYFRTGRIAGNLIKQFSRLHSQIISFTPPSVMLNNNFRNEGIRESFKGDSDYTLAGIVELTTNHLKNVSIIENHLKDNPAISSIIYNGDISTLQSAVARINRPLQTICFDLVEDSKASLLSGRIKAIITQSQEEQGYYAVKCLFQYLLSGIVPAKDITVDSSILIKECID